MAFPQTPLNVRTELKIGGVWTDVTSDTYHRDLISISRGRRDEGSRADPGRCTITFNNRAGKYSPRNPVGAYYGLIGRNTPVRVAVYTGSTYLNVPGGAGDGATTPDTAVLDIVGDLDVRLELQGIAPWMPVGSSDLIGKYDNVTPSNQRSWRLEGFNNGPRLSWSPDGTLASFRSANSTAPVPMPASGRIAVRATLDVDNGSGGCTVTFYTAASIAGPWTQLGDPVVAAGTTSIYASTTPLTVGDATNSTALPTAMRVMAAEVRNGIGGTVVANPDFTAQAAGATGFTDSAGRAWTVAGAAELTNRRPRFAGEISAWPPRWDVSGKDLYVPVTAAGPLRRLGQGKSPLQSPMRREFSSPARTGIVAYWPMEDGAEATALASAIAGQPALGIAGDVEPAAYSTWAASAALPTMHTGRLAAALPAYTVGVQSELRLFAQTPAGGVGADQRLLSVSTTGSAATWSLWVSASGADFALRAYGTTGALLMDSGWSSYAAAGRQIEHGLQLIETGGNVAWSFFGYSIADSSLSGAVVAGGTGGTLAGHTVGRVVSVRVGEDGALGDTAVGHLALANVADAYAATGSAMVAWAGESAADRIIRLCRETQVPLAMRSFTTSSAPLGPQRIATFLTLLEEAATADGSLVYEDRETVGLAYRTQASLYNQAAALALNYAAAGEVAPPLEPTDDDQGTVNDVTVKRQDGGSARAEQRTGPLSVLDPPAGIGRYDTELTLEVAADSQLADIAGWRLRLGTWDESRFPTVRVDLAAGPHLIAAASAVDVRDRITISNPPPSLPPDLIDLIAEGCQERLGQYDWDLVFNCSPGGPWRVGVLDDTVLGRADTDGSQLAAGVSSTATSLSVATTSGPLWTTAAAEFPFDVRVAGERLTVTNITGTTSPQTFTVVRSVNGVVKAQLAAADVRLEQPMILAL